MSKEASTARGTGDAGIAGDLKGGQERVTESEIDGSGRFAAAAGNRVAGARESSYRYPTGAWLGEVRWMGDATAAAAAVFCCCCRVTLVA